MSDTSASLKALKALTKATSKASKTGKAGRVPTRISHLDFSDLHHDIERLTPQRALTRAELIILRVRDFLILTEDEKKLLSLISDEIHKLQQAHIDIHGYKG